jgi:hypothetical protein
MDAAHVEPAISSVSYSNPCDRVTNNGGRNGGDKESDPCNEQTDEMHYARIRDEADSCQCDDVRKPSGMAVSLERFR